MRHTPRVEAAVVVDVALLLTAQSAPARAASAPRGESQAEIREWARAQGYAVGDRGRIPVEVRSAYDAARSNSTTRV